MNVIFPYTGNVIIPTDELHHFSEGLAQPPTSYGYPWCLIYPMDPSTFLGSVWGIIYYNLEA